MTGKNDKADGKKELQEIWDYTKNNRRLGDSAGIRRGEIKNRSALPMTDCVVTEKCVKNMMIHEQPGYAECCKKCPAYKD
jgi:hypothetical protein